MAVWPNIQGGTKQNIATLISWSFKREYYPIINMGQKDVDKPKPFG